MRGSKVHLLAKEAQGYIDLFTGGDHDIEVRLNQAYGKTTQWATKRGIEQKVFVYETSSSYPLEKGVRSAVT